MTLLIMRTKDDAEERVFKNVERFVQLSHVTEYLNTELIITPVPINNKNEIRHEIITYKYNNNDYYLIVNN